MRMSLSAFNRRPHARLTHGYNFASENSKYPFQPFEAWPLMTVMRIMVSLLVPTCMLTASIEHRYLKLPTHEESHCPERIAC